MLMFHRKNVRSTLVVDSELSKDMFSLSYSRSHDCNMVAITVKNEKCEQFKIALTGKDIQAILEAQAQYAKEGFIW